MAATNRVTILCLLILQWGTLVVLAYPTGAPLCDFGTQSLAIIQGGMQGPNTGGGLAANSGITWTMSATSAPAGGSVSLNFTNAAGMLLGFLIYAQHQDGNRYGVFELNKCIPAGYAKYVNATMVPGGCPGGNGPTITQSNNNCDFTSYLFVYKSDPNHPGPVTFNVFMMIDGNFVPDARGNWFILNPQTVNFIAPAGTTGSMTTGYYFGPTTAKPATSAAVQSNAAVNTPAAAASAKAGLSTNAIAGIIIGVILAVVIVAVFLFPIIFAATHKDDPRVKRITQRMTNTFKR